MYKPPYVVLVTETDTPQKISDYFLERGFTWFGSKTLPNLNSAVYIRTMVGGGLNYADDTNYLHPSYGPQIHLSDLTDEESPKITTLSTPVSSIDWMSMNPYKDNPPLKKFKYEEKLIFDGEMSIKLDSKPFGQVQSVKVSEPPKLTHLDGFKLPLAISVDKNNFNAVVAKIKANGINWCCAEPVTYGYWNYVVILDSSWASSKDKKWYLYSHQGSSPKDVYSNLTVITGAKFLALKPKLTECVIRFGCDKTFKQLQRRLFNYGYEWKPGGKNLLQFCGFNQIKVIPETNGFYYVLKQDDNAIPANVFLNEDHTNRV